MVVTHLTRFSPTPHPMADENLVNELLAQILGQVSTLNNTIHSIQIDQAKTRGEMATKVLEQANIFDLKLMDAERRTEAKMSARAEKIEGWLDEMQQAFSKYQTTMEGRMTSVSVKIASITGGITLVIGGIVAMIVRYFSFTSTHQ
jgi:hypothetical protein